jgi:hypothetical protein
MLVLSSGKPDDGRKFLLERSDIVVTRVNYITIMNSISIDGSRTFVLA